MTEDANTASQSESGVSKIRRLMNNPISMIGLALAAVALGNIFFLFFIDLTSEHPDFDPNRELKFEAKEPNDAEKRLAKRQPPYDAEPDDEKGYPVASVEF